MNTARCIAAAALIFCHSAHAWKTEKSTDSFTGKTSTIQTSTSTNSLRLSFPYQGKNHAHLVVVTPQGEAPMVFLEIDKGQIACDPSYCAVAVKFGNLEPRNFVVEESGTPGDNTYVRFIYTPEILEALAQEPNFIVRFPVYGDGRIDATFKNKTALPPPR